MTIKVRFVYAHGAEISVIVRADGPIPAVERAKELIFLDFPHWTEVLGACESVVTEIQR